jgi:LmbE family N-acetylglucosaminyl deacetylase
MAPSELRLLGVFAHPDDESLGTGGTLAHYAKEGVATHLLCATRGDRGRYFDQPKPGPGPEVVGREREAELRAAARELGVRDVRVLGYPDGGLAGVDAAEAIAAIAAEIRRIKPQVVMTFGPDGAYGHADHIAISQLTSAAIVAAADTTHRVSKLYYLAWSGQTWAAYEAALKKLVYRVDGVERQAVPWPDWAITTSIDATAEWETVWRAVRCHQTQISIYSALADLPQAQQRALWGRQEFYRVFSAVPVGPGKETDLFEGLR